MKRLVAFDILDIDAYESIRSEYRSRVIAHKKIRRVSVGDRATLLFEDRETLRYQIQEMIRVERTRDAGKIQNELDVYNELVPDPLQLSATLFIEIPDLAQIRRELDRLIGIDEHVALVLGDGRDGATEDCVRARFDERQMEEDRISAVHYLKFDFTPAQLERFCAADAARLRISHPHYTHESHLAHETRRSLIRDLSDDPALLLDEALRAQAEAGLARDEVLFEGGGVRVLRPARPAWRRHVIVEPSTPVRSILEVDPVLETALHTQVRRFAGELAQDGTATRVSTDVSKQHGAGLRWHIYARPD